MSSIIEFNKRCWILSKILSLQYSNIMISKVWYRYIERLTRLLSADISQFLKLLSWGISVYWTLMQLKQKKIKQDEIISINCISLGFVFTI